MPTQSVGTIRYPKMIVPMLRVGTPLRTLRVRSGVTMQDPQST